MPGINKADAHGAKRKRVSSSTKPLKRRKSDSSDEEDAQAHILLLESEIFESKKNYNNISTLINTLTEKGRKDDDSLVAAISLCRIFTRFAISGDLTKKAKASDKEAVVIQWLRDRYAEYKKGLLLLLKQESRASTALALCMRILKTDGETSRQDQYEFPSEFLQDIIRTLLSSETSSDVRKEFSEKFVEEHDDLRFYTFEALKKVLEAQGGSPEYNLSNALEIISVESVPESKDELEDFYVPAPKTTTHALYSLPAHKKRAQEAWLALLRLARGKDEKKELLGMVSTTIAPWFSKPELLMDFLTDSYNTGGSTSLLALSGVFYLIQERNLDYPSFYLKLYSLLDRGILHSKHRSRFLRLMDTFLASTHLPAVLVASFIKRLSRLALNAPPAAIVVIVPWIYNILKKHPACTFMIHREARGAEAKALLEEEGLTDPFLEDEEDPMETKAIDSCLWEIVTLQSHYHPNVATLAKIISEQFTKHSYNLEDFLDHSYGSMLEAELSKDVKKIPVVEYEIPKRVYMKQDADSGVEDSLLVKLWNFN